MLLDLRSLLEAGAETGGETAEPEAMPSETDFLNDALNQVGADPIAAITDGTKNANHCLRFYPSRRRALLRAHHWNFAEDRQILSQDDAAPAFGYSYAYTLPSTLLKMSEYNGGSLDLSNPSLGAVRSRFKIEGRKLLSNDAEALIVFVQDVTNPTLWDALFYQALSAWLGSALALAIPKDERKSTALLDQAMRILLPLATSVDGQEGGIVPFEVNDLTWGR